MEIGLIVTLLLVLGAEFVNGWTDASNAITTVVSTRTLSLRTAVILAVVFNVLGALMGTAVATTIGKGIVDSGAINLVTIAAAKCSIIVWSTLAAKYGLPTSESHALIAGLAGAGLATAGPGVLLWAGWEKVLIGIAFSTFLGLSTAYILTKVARRIAAPFPPRTTKPLFKFLQIISSSFLAFSHGSNDGQKFIGIFALALVVGNAADKFSIPFWVILVCAAVMGIGTAFKGVRIIHTMGVKMLPLQTYQGFSAETAAASTITVASHFGIPLSTTHTIGTSIVGTGIAHRRSSLRMEVLKRVIFAWLFTFPICGALAFCITLVLRLIF
ncbi:MAG: inorganic phosphate transporter [Candidatus Spechtbacteria bacterium]|nr:inorganic phosphate transporter [Candidatus Spechtbacteria bacterium]